ncbi:MAG: DUF3885 domain-containing protein [Pseudomonadota bacterium]
MSIPELSQKWRSNFGETPPHSEWLWWNHRNSGFRIHSLPKAKRYADSEDEMRIILERSNTMASHVLGDGQDVWLISSIPSEFRAEFEMDNDTPIARHALSYWCEWKRPEDEPEYQDDWTSFARKLSWSAGKFNPLLKSIADDEDEGILWFSPTFNTVFAPYDGGVDVWVKSEEQLESLYHTYKDWI